MICQVVGYILLSFLAADFIAGVFHWWEDRYANEEWPLIGKWVSKPNQLHHSQPLVFLNQSYWLRNSTTIIPSALLFILAVLFCKPLCLTFLILSQGNEIHAWAHQKGKLSQWVVVLQDIGLLQSPKDHAVHHATENTYYCPITDYLNPVLEAVGFWSFLESLVKKFLRVEVRHAA